MYLLFFFDLCQTLMNTTDFMLLNVMEFTLIEPKLMLLLYQPYAGTFSLQVS